MKEVFVNDQEEFDAIPAARYLLCCVVERLAVEVKEVGGEVFKGRDEEEGEFGGMIGCFGYEPIPLLILIRYHSSRHPLAIPLVQHPTLFFDFRLLLSLYYYYLLLFFTFIIFILYLIK